MEQGEGCDGRGWGKDGASGALRRRGCAEERSESDRSVGRFVGQTVGLWGGDVVTENVILPVQPHRAASTEKNSAAVRTLVCPFAEKLPRAAHSVHAPFPRASRFFFSRCWAALRGRPPFRSMGGVEGALAPALSLDPSIPFIVQHPWGPNAFIYEIPLEELADDAVRGAVVEAIGSLAQLVSVGPFGYRSSFTVNPTRVAAISIVVPPRQALPTEEALVKHSETLRVRHAAAVAKLKASNKRLEEKYNFVYSENIKNLEARQAAERALVEARAANEKLMEQVAHLNEDLQKVQRQLKDYEETTNTLAKFQARVALGGWIEFARDLLMNRMGVSTWPQLYNKTEADPAKKDEFFDLVREMFDLSRDEWLLLSKEFYKKYRCETAHGRPPADEALEMSKFVPEQFQGPFRQLIEKAAAYEPAASEEGI